MDAPATPLVPFLFVVGVGEPYITATADVVIEPGLFVDINLDMFVDVRRIAPGEIRRQAGCDRYVVGVDSDSPAGCCLSRTLHERAFLDLLAVAVRFEMAALRQSPTLALHGAPLAIKQACCKRGTS